MITPILTTKLNIPSLRRNLVSRRRLLTRLELVGDQVEYHVLLFNPAAVTATEVWIEDYVPADTSYVPNSATTTNGTISGPDPLRVDAGEQLPLEMLFFRFRVTVDSVSFITTITNTATAAAGDHDPMQAQAVIGPTGGDDVGLVIGKVIADVNGPPLYEGDVLEYTMTCDLLQSGSNEIGTILLNPGNENLATNAYHFALLPGFSFVRWLV